MSFMLTVLSVDAEHDYETFVPPLIVQPVVVDADAWARAGNTAALARYPGCPSRGRAFYLLLDEDGYQTSNAFFKYADTDDEPAVLALPPAVRGQCEKVLRDLVDLSPSRQIVVVCEDNGHVTDPDLTHAEIETIECFGPLTLAEFWAKADRQQVREDSVIIVHEAPSAQA